MKEHHKTSGKPFHFRFLTGFLTAAYCVCLASPAGYALWDGKFRAGAETPERAAAGAAECVMEAESRRILYERQGDVPLPMASTTKILTAVTVLENASLEEEFPVPEQAAGVEGSSVYLEKGAVYSVKDLLYGLMLRSGNDCAEALALHVSGSIGEFAQKMNETAEKAGALHSFFKNPHGLPCEGHYTTARDLTLITCYAMHNSVFREIVGTRYYASRGWENKNKMLRRYEGATGVKTGYTKEAGRCLVTSAERGGMTLVCTVLNCPAMYERTERLLDDAFGAYERVCVLDGETPLAVGNEIGRTGESLFYPMYPEEREHFRIETAPRQVFGREKNDEIIGEVKIYLLNRLIFSRNLYKL